MKKSEKNIPREVREFCIERDAGLCQQPKCRNKMVDLHHIIYRSQHKDHSPSNLVSLCRKHHDLAHLKKEWREYWENWKPISYFKE